MWRGDRAQRRIRRRALRVRFGRRAARVPSPITQSNGTMRCRPAQDCVSGTVPVSMQQLQRASGASPAATTLREAVRLRVSNAVARDDADPRAPRRMRRGSRRGECRCGLAAKRSRRPVHRGADRPNRRSPGGESSRSSAVRCPDRPQSRVQRSLDARRCSGPRRPARRPRRRGDAGASARSDHAVPLRSARRSRSECRLGQPVHGEKARLASELHEAAQRRVSQPQG